jgi:hypothetical protein
MPRLSLYRPDKSNDYRFFDKTIKEMFVAGATDLYIHKYIGANNQVGSVDATQPHYDTLDPLNIQDLLFLENRDRKYDSNIYRLRGHYNVQNLDFDLSQFGLFLNNDIIFITIHYNEMIDIIGRKLMVGDVIELPHLTDYHPLNEAIPTSLRRYYQVTDGNFASEGFSNTWLPHLWRIKCEPLVDSQEFSNILSAPIEKDNYLGDWTTTDTYPEGYTVTYGDKTYIAIQDVPVGTPCTDPAYWQLDTADNLRDILATYNKNIAINDAAIAEAARLLPKSGYDRSQLYVVPTFEDGQPAPPVNIVTTNGVAPVPTRGTVDQIYGPSYGTPSPVIRIGAAALKSIWDMTADGASAISEFISVSLSLAETAPERMSTGSGRVDGDTVLAVRSMGPVSGPFGTSDNTFSTGDQNPVAPNFSGEISQAMDYRADCDPRFQFIVRTTPRGFGYLTGYLAGDGTAPNGLPVGSGITFPSNPQSGDYFLRLDYLPQQLFRWNGTLWVKISDNVRTGTGFTEDDKSMLSTFINNNNVTTLTDGSTMPEQQALSTILTITPD